MKKAILNWSGGKDSCLCLHKILEEKKYQISYLLTTINSEHNRISMHGVRDELLELQSQSIGIPINKVMLAENVSMEDYNLIMNRTLSGFVENNIKISIFGDIFLEDLRKYREEQLGKLNIMAYFPLWKRSTKELVSEFIDLGYKAVIVCVNERYLDKSFSGREIDNNLINELPMNVDPCGENGEYHTFVYDGPIFKNEIKFNIGKIIRKQYKSNVINDSGNSEAFHDKSWDTGFWYCDLIPSV